MADWRIEPLGSRHDRGRFACGKPLLDDFLRTLVSQYGRRGLGRTFVALTSPGERVIGCYTLSSGSVSYQNLPQESARKLPRHPVPVVLLARLAVDRSAQGQGLGSLLLLDALRRSLHLADRLGIHAVEVHALDEDARSFYERYGFVPLLDHPFHLYLPIAVLRRLPGLG